jgi:hypothetical protein
MAVLTGAFCARIPVAMTSVGVALGYQQRHWFARGRIFDGLFALLNFELWDSDEAERHHHSGPQWASKIILRSHLVWRACHACSCYAYAKEAPQVLETPMNGHAAVRLTIEPPTAPEQHPAVAGPPDPVADVIGAAVADAVIAIRGAVDTCLRTGTFTLDPESKREGGDLLARIVMMQLDHELGDDDFIHKAHTAGRRALAQHFTDGPPPVDPAVWINDLFRIVGPIVKNERTYRIAWAN